MLGQVIQLLLDSFRVDLLDSNAASSPVGLCFRSTLDVEWRLTHASYCLVRVLLVQDGTNCSSILHFSTAQLVKRRRLAECSFILDDLSMIVYFLRLPVINLVCVPLLDIVLQHILELSSGDVCYVVMVDHDVHRPWVVPVCAQFVCQRHVDAFVF